jgi:MoaA/NifB/PqqE/SkfB family radical SAM enzyme
MGLFDGEPALSFTWDLWYACNYRCSYCWWEMEDLWDKLAEQNRVLPAARWAQVWERIHRLHGPARIDLIGGEPLIYPGIGELLRELSRLHAVQVTTNLSLPEDKLAALAAPLSPERVRFNASFHPQFAPLEEFTARLDLLRARGFAPGVLFVPWPPLLAELERYRRWFRDRDYPFTLMTFQGKWNGASYPDAYTGAERALIAGMIDHQDRALEDGERRYRLDGERTKGKLCHAGRVYANVKGNGDVYRCGQDAFGRQPMGNILDPEFRLLPEARPCPYERCSCLEFRYLDEIMTKAAA